MNITNKCPGFKTEIMFGYICKEKVVLNNVFNLSLNALSI